MSTFVHKCAHLYTCVHLCTLVHSTYAPPHVPILMYPAVTKFPQHVPLRMCPTGAKFPHSTCALSSCVPPRVSRGDQIYSKCEPNLFKMQSKASRSIAKQSISKQNQASPYHHHHHNHHQHHHVRRRTLAQVTYACYARSRSHNGLEAGGMVRRQ